MTVELGSRGETRRGRGPVFDSKQGGMPGFLSALRGELSLTRRRPAVWVSLGVWAACIAVFAYFVSYVSTIGAEWYTPEQQEMFLEGMLPQGTAFYVLASMPLYGAPQLALLGAVLGASDYSRGTISTLLTRFPRRASFLAARLANLVLIAMIAAVVSMATSLAASVFVAMAAGRDSEFPPLGNLVMTTLAVWLNSAAFILFGFTLGVITRNMIAAVAIALGWLLGVESLLIAALAPIVPVLDGVRGWLPVGATSSLAAGFVPDGFQTVPPVSATIEPGIAVLVLLGWACVAGAVAAAVSLRRDV